MANDELGVIVDDGISAALSDIDEATDLINRDLDDEDEGESEDSPRPSVNLDADDPSMQIDPLSDKILHCKTCGNRMRPMLTIQGECPRCAMKRMRYIESKLIKLKQINPDNKYCVLDAHGVAYKNQLDPNFNKITVMGVDFYPPGDICMQCMTNLRSYFTKFLEDRGISRKANNHEKNPFAQTNLKLSVPEQLELIRRFEQFMLSVNAYANDKESGLSDVTKFYIEKQRQLLKKEAKTKWQERNEQMKRLQQSTPILQQLPPTEDASLAVLKIQRLIENHGLKFLKKLVLSLNFVEEPAENLPQAMLWRLVQEKKLRPILQPNQSPQENEEDEFLRNALQQEISYQMGPRYVSYVERYTNLVVQKYNQWISDLASEQESLV